MSQTRVLVFPSFPYIYSTISQYYNRKNIASIPFFHYKVDIMNLRLIINKAYLIGQLACRYIFYMMHVCIRNLSQSWAKEKTDNMGTDNCNKEMRKRGRHLIRGRELESTRT